jgi:hypothetical protein
MAYFKREKPKQENDATQDAQNDPQKSWNEIFSVPNAGVHANQGNHQAEERRHWRHQRRFNNLSPSVTFLTFLVAIYAAAVAQDAFVQTKRQAKAAEDQIAIAKETAQRQRRAYLTVGIEIPPDIDAVGPISTTIFIKNAGQTPAYEVVYWLGIDIANWPRPLSTELRPPPRRRFETIVVSFIGAAIYSSFGEKTLQI